MRATRTSRGPATMGVPTNRLKRVSRRKRQEEASFKTAVECAAVARATRCQAFRLVVGMPQFTTMRLRLLENSNDKQPACASLLSAKGGGRPVSAITMLRPASTR